mgnify:CR=1 FL=1
MPTQVSPILRIRKLLEAIDDASAGTEALATLTPQLEQLVAPGAAPYSEIVRAGRAFQTHMATAVAAVVAIPTTAHMFSIYNGDPDGGRVGVIDWVAATNVVSTAVASQAQLIGLVGQVREAIPTNAALTITKMNGLGDSIDSVMRTLLTGTALPTTTGTAANWFPIGPSVGKPGAAGTPGYGLWAPVDGRIEVPPGRYFSMHVLANVVGETFLGYISWHEKPLQLG